MIKDMVANIIRGNVKLNVLNANYFLLAIDVMMKLIMKNNLIQKRIIKLIKIKLNKLNAIYAIIFNQFLKTASNVKYN